MSNFAFQMIPGALFVATALLVLPLHAELIETSIDWRPVCEGATIEVIRKHGAILSVRAYATHSLTLREWTVHYASGQAVTAEFRERQLGKIEEGKRAGENSGVNPIKQLRTFKAKDGKFVIEDVELGDELASIFKRMESVDDPE